MEGLQLSTKHNIRLFWINSKHLTFQKSALEAISFKSLLETALPVEASNSYPSPQR